MQTYSPEEVSQHNSSTDCWVSINGSVYDLTKFLKLHPGGRQILLAYAGKDASDVFPVYHNDSILKKYHSKFCIGSLTVQPPKRPLHIIPGTFGDLVPYGDPIWYQRFNSPYYKETHRKWRAHVRNFVEEEIVSTIETWKNDPLPPADLLLKMGKAGLLASMCGPPWPTKYLPSTIVAPEDFDYFHELITYDEIARCGYAHVFAAITNGPAIALTAVLRFGTEEMRQEVAPSVLQGEKFIALAISEPQAGSDVAGMVTSATKSPDGQYYIVNGNKKWITNGTYSEYFVTAVKTGGKGQLSFLLVHKDTPGFTVRKLNCRGLEMSGTAYLDFDNCHVPVKNLIGKENEGFKLIMFNFNHERFYISVTACRFSRICLEESLKYALKRKAFGKSLSEIQTIRMKISSMAREVESLQAWIELVTYQMCTMSHSEANLKIGDVISLVKAQASKVYELCARETTMIFGGNALYVEGVGRKIEGSVMQVKGYQIPAGAEDVMDDYAARIAFKTALKVAKI